AFKEAVFVGASISSQRVDQTDVRAFRRFDRTYTTVVSRMYVAHFKARAFAGQTAWSQCGDTTLVRHFRQRVVLVHELGQLAGTEELFDRGGHWLGVDHVLWHQAIAVSHRQTLFH